MENLWGLILSLLYIGFVLIIATMVAKYTKGSSEISRKLIHIMVGNWIFITPIFTELWAVILVPFSFIIINSLSMKYNLISAMERQDDSYGTVFYAISMFVLTGAGFILNWPMLPFMGLLIMTYGDGLAAIVGNHIKSKEIINNKTLSGTITVGIVAFLITFGSYLFFGNDDSIILLFFLSLLNAILSSFIELTGKRGCDNLSLPIGSGLFGTLLYTYFSSGLLLYLFVSIAILCVAYKTKSISLDGMVAAILTSIVLYTLGRLYLGISLLTFFILGSVISKLKNDSKREGEKLQEHTEARNWVQVISNTLPASLLVWLALIYPEYHSIFLLLSFSVFSAAAADTFSSEIGMMNSGKVYDILTFKPVKNGVSGGVSILGLIAGLVGSFLLSLLALGLFSFQEVIFITILGFIGSIIDSILGSLLQRKYTNKEGHYQDVPDQAGDKPIRGIRWISNNVVNLISLFLIVIIGHVSYWIF